MSDIPGARMKRPPIGTRVRLSIDGESMEGEVVAHLDGVRYDHVVLRAIGNPLSTITTAWPPTRGGRLIDVEILEGEA